MIVIRYLSVRLTALKDNLESEMQSAMSDYVKRMEGREFC